MEVTVHIMPQDIAEGEDVDFEEKEEHWNVYKLWATCPWQGLP
jgi:hypothetical protein